jgi:hypothetical protein
MQAVLPSRIADALLAEKDAWKRYAAAKGDNWRVAFDEWAEAREAGAGFCFLLARISSICL